MSVPFEPIAIVGQSSLGPGFHSPDELWQAVVENRDLLSNANPKELGVSLDLVLASQDYPHEPGKIATARGGFVRGFHERFDPEGFQIPADQVRESDLQIQWVLHTVRAALVDANLMESQAIAHHRVGAIFGNLGYHSPGMGLFAEQAFRKKIGIDLDSDQYSIDPRYRFTTGRTASVLSRALGLHGKSFGLDAACASSVYAIKLACDELHDRRSDAMLAGAVHCCDPLSIHGGFTSLKALSPTGQSLPFHEAANGLVPTMGAGFLVLMRLSDALDKGQTIAGIIRGIGLSNDGRPGGFLAPSIEGQVRAVQLAQQSAQLRPQDISLIECHATGTVGGDAAELSTLQTVFKDNDDLPIGSVKSNLGHAITVAGVFGLQKILSGFRHQQRPGQRCTGPLRSEASQAGLRVLSQPESWESLEPRRAGLNGFGFGGTNSHLIVEEFVGQDARRRSAPVTNHDSASGSGKLKTTAAVAVVGLAIRAGQLTNAEEFAERLFGATTAIKADRSLDELEIHALENITLDAKTTPFPPNDLRDVLAQQLLLFRTALDACEGINLPTQTTGILTGIETDLSGTRYAARARLAQWLAQRDSSICDDINLSPSAKECDEVADSLAAPLPAAGVIGCMPNIPANRINFHLDCRGIGFSTFGGELSGLHSLDIALRALQAGELDAAIVGAADLSCDPHHQQAVERCLGGAIPPPADAAVVLVLKRLDDAQASGDSIWALFDKNAISWSSSNQQNQTEPQDDFGYSSRPLYLQQNSENSPLSELFGFSYAASGLLHVAAGAIALRNKLRPTFDHRPAWPWVGTSQPRQALVSVESWMGPSMSVAMLEAPVGSNNSLSQIPDSYLADDIQTFRYSGSSAQELRHRFEQDARGGDGPARLALVCSPEKTVELRNQAKAILHGDNVNSPISINGPHGSIYMQLAPTKGECAMFCNSAAAMYLGAGANLYRLVRPTYGNKLESDKNLPLISNWFDPQSLTNTIGAREKLIGSCYLTTLHGWFARDVLKISFDAVMGLSSGEHDMALADGTVSFEEGLLSATKAEKNNLWNYLQGDFLAVRKSWNLSPDEHLDWSVWRVICPLEQLQDIVDREPRVHIAIIHTLNDIVVMGDRNSCQRVFGHLPNNTIKMESADYALAFHVPHVKHAADLMRQSHPFPLQCPPTKRYYSIVKGTHYPLTSQAYVEAYIQQAIQTIDLPTLIEAAYEDGVRIFVEHGPRDLCSRWISQILGDRPHLCVPLDRGGIDSVFQASCAAMQLWTAGVGVDLQAYEKLRQQPLRQRQLNHEKILERESKITLGIDYPAHWQTIKSFANPIKITATFPETFESNALNLEPPKMDDAREPADAKLDGFYSMPSAPSLPKIQALSQSRASEGSQAEPMKTSEVVVENQDDIPAEVQASLDDINRSTVLMEEFHERTKQRHTETFLNYLACMKKGEIAFLNLRRQIRNLLTSSNPNEQLDRMKKAIGLVETSSGSRTTRTSRSHATTSSRSGQTTNSKAVQASIGNSKSSASGVWTSGNNDWNDGNQTQMESPSSQFTIDSVQEGPQPFPWNREQLQLLADGKISRLFGPLFEKQDNYDRQVRLPTRPLMLVDRITNIDAEPGVHSTGVIKTETDVRWDAWYLHHGVMPAGVMIEAGQADLTLISWMGADFKNQNQRVYRLLGCEMTCFRGLAKPGETLRYEIHIDGHASQGDVRLFFFHYDMYIGDEHVMRVRHGQAGFFTDEELANSDGVIWDAQNADYSTDGPLAPPVVNCPARSFSTDQVRAYFEGRLTDCFGHEFWPTNTHTRTPLGGKPSMQFFDELVEFDPNGGPWKRGYLKALLPLHEHRWFYQGHFHNDPCMPGTMMFEGTLQAMAFYLTALGYTIDRDGWRFEPVCDLAYKLLCRGQAIPTSKELTIELFVEEIHDGDQPTLYADLLGTIDGLKAFHCRRMGLQLVPDSPLSDRPWLLENQLKSLPAARVDDLEFNYPSLLHCAIGQPSQAFGKLYQVFDGTRQCPRLPGPPYHFMSRVVKCDSTIGEVTIGGSIELEYEVPTDAWYFDDSGSGSMPFAVLLEVLLQPCGWLACSMGIPTSLEEDVYFRNLDGSGRIEREIGPEDSTLRTRAMLTKHSQFGQINIVGFEVICTCQDERVAEIQTVFGFFSADALANYSGLPPADQEKQLLEQPSEYQRDLTNYRGSNGLRLGRGRLKMLDRITGYWPKSGDAGLGRWRAERTISSDDWYFKAHFFGDPVQPGSLGVEAMAQLLQFHMIERGLGEGIDQPVFEAISNQHEISWTYRGQVIPSDTRLRVELEVVDEGRVGDTAYAEAKAWLWVGEQRIYAMEKLAMRIVPATRPRGYSARNARLIPAESGFAASGREEQFTLDLANNPWIQDHRPTFTIPTAPLMWMADVLVRSAQGLMPDQVVVRLENMTAQRWLTCGQPQRLRTLAQPAGANVVESKLSVWREALPESLSRFEDVANSRVTLGMEYPKGQPTLSALRDASPQEIPYQSRRMFHGPAFWMMRDLAVGKSGASAWLEPRLSQVPAGLLQPGILDALWHLCEIRNIQKWCPAFPADWMCMPSSIERLEFFRPTPTGDEMVRCEVRFQKHEPQTQRIWLEFEMMVNNELWVRGLLIERSFPNPMSRMGVTEAEIEKFVYERLPNVQCHLAVTKGDQTTLKVDHLGDYNWMPGALASIYLLQCQPDDYAWQIGIKEHVAFYTGVHPSQVVISDDCRAAYPGNDPTNRFAFHVQADDQQVEITANQ